jgi:hypothetical protein
MMIIVCDLMGTKAEAAAAEKKMNEWAEQNKERVMRAQRAQQFQDERNGLAITQAQAAATTSTYDKNIMMLYVTLHHTSRPALVIAIILCRVCVCME